MVMKAKKVQCAGVDFASMRQFCMCLNVSPTTYDIAIHKYGSLENMAKNNLSCELEQLSDRLQLALSEYQNDPAHRQGRAKTGGMNEQQKIAAKVVLRYALASLKKDDPELQKVVSLAAGIDYQKEYDSIIYQCQNWLIKL